MCTINHVTRHFILGDNNVFCRSRFIFFFCHLEELHVFPECCAVAGKKITKGEIIDKLCI